MTNRTLISTGTTWETLAGYSRAVRLGNSICISGTTATDDTGQIVGLGSAAEQTEFIIKKIETTLHKLGASLSDIVRTRIYITHLQDWEAVSRVHGQYFGSIRPANTLVVVAALIGDDYRVEIDADALLTS
jgi:enamine deaminase RidA (YjgF/YER057c/UK114 family)